MRLLVNRIDDLLAERPSEESIGDAVAAINKCPICLTNVRDIALCHCGHLFCLNCLKTSLELSRVNQCSLCRAQIVGVVRIYF